MSKAETAAHTPGEGHCRSPAPPSAGGIAAYQGAHGSPGSQAGCLLSQISLAKRYFLSSFLLTPCHHVCASPSNCSSEMHNLDFPATKNWLTKRTSQPSLVIPAFLFLLPLTPKPFYSPHLIFWASPPWQLRSPNFKHFVIQPNTDKVPPVCNQD